MLELEQQAFTISEFCARNRISLTTFHKLRKEGRAPRLMRFGHTARISIEAERDWRVAEEERALSEDERLQHQRRQKANSVLGKRAAASPLHVSKQRRAVAARGVS
jgi:hypothetical protein